MDKRYKNVSLNVDLVSRIEQIMNNGGFGYTSVTQFVKEAVRLRCDELESRIYEITRIEADSPGRIVPEAGLKPH